MATKTKKAKIRTPKGQLVYPCYIAKPDTKFSDAKNPNDKGEFKARIALDAKAAAPFIEELERQFQEALEVKKIELGKKVLKVGDDARPWMDEADRETGEPTGRVIIKTKMKARIARKDGTVEDMRPVVFDARGKPITKVPPIGFGTVAKLSATPSFWHNGGKGFGMTLYLNAVQIIELVEWSPSMDAGSYGFEEEEGYEFSDEGDGSTEFSDESDDNGGDY